MYCDWGGGQVAAIGSVCGDEVGLSMCVISHVHCDQPPGTHRLILSLKVTQHTYNNKIFRAVMQILLHEYVCNYDYTIITKTHRIEI